MSEERTFKCVSCHKELGIFEIHHLAGEDVYDSVSGMRYGTGNNYCKKCYDGLTGQNIDKEELAKLESESPVLLEHTDKIKNLSVNQTSVNLVVDIIEKVETKVEKFGKSLRLGKFKIKDDSGISELTLWENIVDLVKVGDRVIIKNGFVREFMKQKQITLGKDGELINLSDE